MELLLNLDESNSEEKNKNRNNDIIYENDLNKNMFEFNYIIGKGGFGKVWKVQYKKTKEYFALKEMSKRKIIDKKSENSINSEKKFLSFLHHPFIVNMHYAFQDMDNLYLVIDLLTGGDLRYHISRYRTFSEEQTRFFITCIIYSLSYIHSYNVIHRDIKPENLVLEQNGYLRITDFGIAKDNLPDNSSETSGTPGYMSPEVMKGLNHSFPADFFAIGVIGYEFLMGRRPYNGKNRKEIKEKMFSEKVIINSEQIKSDISVEAIDFINKLLERKQEKRLGSKNGVKELMSHPWLKYYPWDELKEKSLPPPFIPEQKDNFDKKYCESIEIISEETKIRYEEIFLSTTYRNAFVDFYFNKDKPKFKRNSIKRGRLPKKNSKNDIYNNESQDNNYKGKKSENLIEKDKQSNDSEETKKQNILEKNLNEHEEQKSNSIEIYKRKSMKSLNKKCEPISDNKKYILQNNTIYNNLSKKNIFKKIKLINYSKKKKNEDYIKEIYKHNIYNKKRDKSNQKQYSNLNILNLKNNCFINPNNKNSSLEALSSRKMKNRYNIKFILNNKFPNKLIENYKHFQNKSSSKHFVLNNDNFIIKKNSNKYKKNIFRVFYLNNSNEENKNLTKKLYNNPNSNNTNESKVNDLDLKSVKNLPIFIKKISKSNNNNTDNITLNIIKRDESFNFKTKMFKFKSIDKNKNMIYNNYVFNLRGLNKKKETNNIKQKSNSTGDSLNLLNKFNKSNKKKICNIKRFSNGKYNSSSNIHNKLPHFI